jgi:hypothetical protein
LFGAIQVIQLNIESPEKRYPGMKYLGAECQRFVQISASQQVGMKESRELYSPNEHGSEGKQEALLPGRSEYSSKWTFNGLVGLGMESFVETDSH